jgi:hypothetical protein
MAVSVLSGDQTYLRGKLWKAYARFSCGDEKLIARRAYNPGTTIPECTLTVTSGKQFMCKISFFHGPAKRFAGAAAEFSRGIQQTSKHRSFR